MQRLLVEQGLAIARELYLALVLDRETRRVTVMASTEGGVEIEEVAHKTPEKILQDRASTRRSACSRFQARQLALRPRARRATRPRSSAKLVRGARDASS